MKRDYVASESTWSEIPRRQSQTPLQPSQRRVYYVYNILMFFHIIWYVYSKCWTCCIDSVDIESHSKLTQLTVLSNY